MKQPQGKTVVAPSGERTRTGKLPGGGSYSVTKTKQQSRVTMGNVSRLESKSGKFNVTHEKGRNLTTVKRLSAAPSRAVKSPAMMKSAPKASAMKSAPKATAPKAAVKRSRNINPNSTGTISRRVPGMAKAPTMSRSRATAKTVPVKLSSEKIYKPKDLKVPKI